MSWYPARNVYDGLKNVFKNIPIGGLAATGTPSSATFLRGDGTWNTPSGGGGGGTTTPAASTIAEWDANVNMSADAFLPGQTSTAASSTPTAMTIDSTQVQIITNVVTPDNSATSARQSALASGTPFTWSSGGGTAGAYGIVFVPCTNGVMDLTATAVVTWGGVAMTSLGFAYNANVGTTQGWGWVFALPSVAAGGAGIPGGAQTISVTLTQAGQTFTGYGSSYSYKGVGSAGSLQTARGGSGTTPSVAVTAANASDVVWGAINSNNVALTGFSLTTRQSSSVSAPLFLAGDATGSTSVTVSGTGLSQWSAFGLDLIPVTAHTIKLPTASVAPGYEYVIVNQMSLGNVTVQASDGSTVAIVAPNEIGVFTPLFATPTTNAQWAADVRLGSVSFKVKNDKIVVTTAGTSVVYTLPAASSTLLGSGGPLGTPSSGTLTSCTGLPVAGVAATGTPSSTTYLRGDGTWNTPSGGGGSGSTTPTASTLAEWDANVNMSANRFIAGFATTVTSGTTVVLAVTSAEIQVFTGSTAQLVTLPSTGVVAGGRFTIVNLSSATVTVQSSGGNTITTIAGASSAPYVSVTFTALVAAPTTAANWLFPQAAAAAQLPPSFSPADYGWKWWSFDPAKAYIGSTATTAGQMYFALVPVRAADTISNVILNVGTAGSGLTSGQNFAGLFNSSGTLLSATADQSAAWASTGVKVMALTTPQSVTPGLYYVAFFANGTTPPKFSTDGAANPAIGALSPSRQSIDTTHTGRTTTFFSPATLANSSTAYLAALS